MGVPGPCGGELGLCRAEQGMGGVLTCLGGGVASGQAAGARAWVPAWHGVGRGPEFRALSSPLGSPTFPQQFCQWQVEPAGLGAQRQGETRSWLGVWLCRKVLSRGSSWP